jgi:hypothetical protein
MTTYWLRFTLESDATFGRGDGVPGLVDQEVALDRYGCPYLHGRTLKGLLDEVCADILFALGDASGPWKVAADRIFGRPGSDAAAQGSLHVGHAQLPAALRAALRNEIIRGGWTPQDVTQAVTAVRRQTAMDVGGAPDPHSLRSVRVILRQTPFEARLRFTRGPCANERALLAACVKGFRRAGTARNRGRGRLVARLEDAAGQDLTAQWYAEFKQEVCPCSH